MTDPVKHEIYNQKDFRIALSVAIDRQEIIDILYAGIGEPWSLAPRRESPYFDEDMAKRWTEYDPEQANALLDGLGYTERDAEGYRLGPDGQRISILVDVRTTNPLQSDGLELIQPRWKDIGDRAEDQLDRQRPLQGAAAFQHLRGRVEQRRQAG